MRALSIGVQVGAASEGAGHEAGWCLWGCELGEATQEMILTQPLMSWHLVDIIFFTL